MSVEGSIVSASAAEQLSNPIVQQHYRDLPASLFAVSKPTPSPSPSMIELNGALLSQLGGGADWFRSDHALAILAGTAVADTDQTIAMAYGGHQFGHWVPLLGDGRAHMLGQFVCDDGSAIDVQLKGSGRTRFSRGGDGRATLGAVLREYIVSEAMAGLGIPTTRSLAVIGTGDDVSRERLLPGAILVRTAASHLRVGTFQYASANIDKQGVQALADFVIEHNFPEVLKQPHKYLELLNTVIERQASLIAQWMLVGFIHGVMNTDNMSIVGETIDYGPCAFMDEFHPQKVFSSIDQHGRYAWDKQPSIAVWNLTQLAQALLPLLHNSPDDAKSMAEELLAGFAPLFQKAFYGGLQQKFGLTTEIKAAAPFIESTFTAMTESGIDFTVFFDYLTRVAAGESDTLVLELFDNQRKASDWLDSWRTLRSNGSSECDAMRRANPAVIARNHRVEEAINAAEDDNNFEPFRRLCRVLANPYDVDTADQDLQVPPRPEERVTRTFCGT